MTSKEAIEIIQMERDHCATHNQDAGMSEQYHKEMQSLVDAFDLAIKALEVKANEVCEKCVFICGLRSHTDRPEPRLYCEMWHEMVCSDGKCYEFKARGEGND